MASLTVAPKFVTSPSKEGLTRAVLAYQLRRGATVRIISIQQEQESGNWVAWFHDETNALPKMPTVTRGR